MSDNKKNVTKVITGPRTRWSYANVWKPKTDDNGNEKYSVSLIIPKTDTKTIEKVKAAIRAAYEQGKSILANGNDVPDFDEIHNPLRDGDKERKKDKAYANSYFINANSTRKPGIVDADKEDILDHSEVYSGCYGRASINFFAYCKKGNKGIACGLNNLQKIRDGEPLGGKSCAEDDFADDEDDFLS